MMVDASALLAVVFQEPGFEEILQKMEAVGAVAAGAPTLAETGIVLTARLGPAASGILERMIDELGIQEIPFGEVHWREAVEAYRRFGRGQHPARLDFGDCMSYAVASLSGEPLLFKDDDFGLTDIVSASAAQA